MSRRHANERCVRKTKDRRSPKAPAVRLFEGVWLDGLADRVDDAADLGAQEDQGDDRDDRDDQRVLGEALALLVAADGRDECVKLGHSWIYLLSSRSPRRVVERRK